MHIRAVYFQNHLLSSIYYNKENNSTKMDSLMQVVGTTITWQATIIIVLNYIGVVSFC